MLLDPELRVVEQLVRSISKFGDVLFVDVRLKCFPAPRKHGDRKFGLWLLALAVAQKPALVGIAAMITCRSLWLLGFVGNSMRVSDPRLDFGFSSKRLG